MKKSKYPPKNCRRNYKKNRGFTLIELLVSIMIGSLVISGLLMLVVQLSETDRRELALTQTQRDMSFAVDYISNELKEAIYVYDAECLGKAARGTPGIAANLTAIPPVYSYCPGLKNYLNLNDNLSPILAFWKIESLPYVAYPSVQESLPTTCPSGTDGARCRELLLNRSSYTLVVYGIRADKDDQWLGPARIIRYELREYDSKKLDSLSPTKGYVDPTNAGVTFSSWPNVYTTGGSNNVPGFDSPPALSEQVLVDLVDWKDSANANDKDKPNIPTPSCADANLYSQATPANNSSFYACIRRAVDGQSQDVFVSIRGSAIKRAGMDQRAWNPAYLPTVTAQVQSRGVFNRNPDK